MNLILASGSPRRKELLSLYTTDFTICVSDFDENGVTAPTPAQLVEKLARGKCLAVSAQHPGAVVIGCDTVVDVNGEVKAHLTSKDFLVGLEWVLNALKNEAFNTSMPSETVVGAAEYYDLTKDKGDAAADMTYEDMLAAGVGVEAPDDYTLVFTCKNPCPYFDTVAAYNSFYPASEDLINELGIDGFRSCDYSTMWYNGPYLIEEYIQQNTKSFIPNPNYYAADDVSRFDRFTVTMISDGTVTFQLYQNLSLIHI